jgi:TRAP-type mannitol/chloroaromatic compound transport system permease small subunit
LQVIIVRIFGWSVLAIFFIFLLNNYLVIWRDWPGISPLFSPTGPTEVGLAWGQMSSYIVGVICSVIYVLKNTNITLRDDSEVFTRISAYVIRSAFWSVLFIGLADALISFLRVENLLASIVSKEMTTQLGRPQFRAPLIHAPLIILSLVIASFNRQLCFTWLALMVVVAELFIVFSRFVFSYEQAFMGDLVRFWYAALFLFASAYTLLEDGHVRVDVVYAGFSKKTKGLVNAIGSVVLGIALCSVILLIGMSGKANIINSPLLNIEVSQSGYGMYVKYLMAGFLAVFASTMLIQFTSSALTGIADFRGDPGGREASNEILH